MRVLVFGATGNLGRYFVKDLIANNDEPIVVGRNLEQIEDFNSIEKVECDLLKLELSSLPKNIDSIVYLAQSRKFRSFPEGAIDMLKINHELPIELAKWAIDNSIPSYCYFSTGSVYLDGPEEIKTEDSSLAYTIDNFYVQSKLTTEMILFQFRELFKTLNIVRPFFMYGPYQSSDMLIPRLVNNIKEGKPIILNEEGGIKINPIHSFDASKILYKSLNLPGYNVFNICGDENLSIKDISEVIAQKEGIEPKYEINSIKVVDLIGKMKIHTQLGYQIMNLSTGLDVTK